LRTTALTATATLVLSGGALRITTDAMPVSTKPHGSPNAALPIASVAGDASVSARNV
jgi:cobalamin biosynthesis protein CobD/CbiB